MTFTLAENRCACGAENWNVTATLIACNGCGRTWGRCEGQWRLDPATEPASPDMASAIASAQRILEPSQAQENTEGEKQ